MFSILLVGRVTATLSAFSFSPLLMAITWERVVDIVNRNQPNQEILVPDWLITSHVI